MRPTNSILFNNMRNKTPRILYETSPFFLFWYLALFPGLMSFDPKVLLAKIVSGETTNLWSGSYFWFIKLTTFNGREIFFSSFLTLMILTIAIYRLIGSFPLTVRHKHIVLWCVLASPLYGFTGANISRDVFQCTAIIFLVSYGLRTSQGIINNKPDLIAGLVLLQFANIGIAVAVIYLVILFLSRQFKLFITLSLCLTTLLLASNWTLQKDSSGQFLSPFISDLKCVVQDKDARISPDDLDFLYTLAQKQIWNKPVSCSVADITNISINSPKTDFRNLSRFFTVYARIAIHNGPTVIMAHIQRSRGSLPPPFFPGPTNQINLDPMVPVGLNSNFALQDGAPAIHPSLDDKNYSISNPLSELLFPIVQVGAFLINQASWFWGWGGLWMWPIAIAALQWRKLGYIQNVSFIFLPILAVHFLYFLFTPSPSPRFYLGTILTGFSMLIAVIIKGIDKSQN